MADKSTTKKTTTEKPTTDKPVNKAGDAGKSGDKTVKNDKPIKNDKVGTQDKKGTQEETKGEERQHKGPRKQPGEFHYRKPYFKRKEKGEREEITLETKVPELPKKNERINQPDDAQFEKQIQNLYAEIDDLYAKMRDVSSKEVDKVSSSAKETNTKSKSLRDLLQEKSDKRKTLRAELDVLVEQMNGYNNALEEYHDKSGRYRQHMKKWFKKEDIVRELEALKHQQSHAQLTIPEEKKIIKEITDLERALPYAEPLERLEKEFADIKEKRKELKKQLKEKRDILKLISDEVTDIRTQLDSFRDAVAKNREEAAPTIKKIQDEYREKINEKKARIATLKKEHDEQWVKYEEQQELIRRIQYMQRVQERLRRDEEKRKKWEEEQKAREAEEAELRKLTIPYREEMELCDLLISYLERLKPKVGEELPKEKTEEERKADIQNALQSDEWKKAKVQIISNKRDTDNDFFAGTQKKNKKKAPVKQETRDENAIVQHSIDILNYFDSLKISPPLVTSALDDAIKSLKEKRDYFEKLSEEERNRPIDDKSKETEKTKDEPKKEEGEKKSPKKTAKKHFEASEHDFPEIK